MTMTVFEARLNRTDKVARVISDFTEFIKVCAEQIATATLLKSLWATEFWKGNYHTHTHTHISFSIDLKMGWSLYWYTRVGHFSIFLLWLIGKATVCFGSGGVCGHMSKEVAASVDVDGVPENPARADSKVGSQTPYTSLLTLCGQKLEAICSLKSESRDLTDKLFLCCFQIS